MPDWRAKVSEAVEANEGKRRRPMMSFNVQIEMRVMLGAAAESRGMSSAAYARRAIAAFIAHDLGIPFESVTKFAPAVIDPENIGEKQARAVAARRTKTGGALRVGKVAMELSFDDGQGYGTWAVCDD